MKIKFIPVAFFIVLAAFCFYCEIQGCLGGGQPQPPPPKPATKEVKPVEMPSWKEVYDKAIANLDEELKSIDTDRATIIEWLSHHPRKSTARVPEWQIFKEHKRHRILALPPEVEKGISDKYVKEMSDKGRFYEDAEDLVRVSNIVVRIASVLPEDVGIRIFLEADDSARQW